jgi:hypothetical protein
MQEVLDAPASSCSHAEEINQSQCSQLQKSRFRSCPSAMMLSRLLRVPSARGIVCRSLASSAAKAPPLTDLKFHMDQGTEGLGIITFDRADRRDALSVEMAHSVVTLVEHLNHLHPGELRCVILTGSSEKSFSAGRDLKVSASCISLTHSGSSS